MFVGDAEHEEVADSFDVGVVAHPVSPHYVGKGAEGGQERWVWVFGVAKPVLARRGAGAVEIEAENC